MIVFNNIFDILGYELKEAPKPYGLFHLCAFAIAIIIAIVLAIKYKKPSEKQGQRIILIISIILFIFEIYKQVIFSYNDGNWSYSWWAFPFQFCSVPMYVGLLAGLIKDGKLRRALYAFLGTFCLFAGLAVMVYPNDVFITTLGISIQTMVHHGGMLIMGIFCLASNKTVPDLKSIYGSALVFLSLVSIAQTLNITLASKGLNMFFISPYIPCSLPILSIIQEKFGYTVFIFTYLLGFIFIAFLILRITTLIKKTHKKRVKKVIIARS